MGERLKGVAAGGRYKKTNISSLLTPVCCAEVLMIHIQRSAHSGVRKHNQEVILHTFFTPSLAFSTWCVYPWRAHGLAGTVYLVRVTVPALHIVARTPGHAFDEAAADTWSTTELQPTCSPHSTVAPKLPCCHTMASAGVGSWHRHKIDRMQQGAMWWWRTQAVLAAVIHKRDL